MNDYEYEFRQDVKEKKSIGRSSRSMNRTGKGPIKFPSDYLTTKEKKKLNGPVVSYDMGKPISYTVFKELPVDIRREYFQGMLNKFRPTDEAIAKMWGVAKGTPWNIRKNLGIKALDRNGKKFDKEAWDKWLNGEEAKKADPKPVDKEKFVPTPDPIVIKETIQEKIDIPEQPVYISKDPVETLKIPDVSKDSQYRSLGNASKLWSTYLANKLMPLKPKDVAAMLAMVKLAYISSGNASMDDWKQLAELATIAGELE